MDVEFRLLETEPKLESERWADIDEGDLATDTGSVRLTSGFESKNYIPGGRDGVTPPGPSLHRVRVGANGRGRNYDLVTSDTDTLEMYLIRAGTAETQRRIRELRRRVREHRAAEDARERRRPAPY